ncbi:SDR family NAD(P)-dependent oxidoreductase [Hyalangium versicolor]|uniref:SDR family NAD(P)-dependent oxidoreductase n=1 Tax=Hyalangium versicolor TaxID=2861190 RepID=UPI001CCE85C7|nr:SDR family NAD(P)-dependent oxidoreductase [Hyalangium versicolor]
MPQAKGTVLVTGGNRGIGFEVCRQLARAGMRVLLTARDTAGGEQAARTLRTESLDVVFEPLDVASQESILTLATKLERQGQRLSALVNNAAITMDGFDARVAEQTTVVNFFGAWLVAERLGLLLEKHGRLVMVSSDGGELGRLCPEIRRRFDPPPSKETLAALVREFIEDVRSGQFARKGWPRSAYRVSKAALNALTRRLAEEFKERQLLVNAVCPGWVRTRMGGPSAPLSVEAGADTIAWAAMLPPDGPSGGFFQDRKPIAW